MTQQQEQNLNIAKQYFEKVDAVDNSLIKLFSEDVQIFFAKFGIGKGLADLQSFATVFGGTFKNAIYHFDEFHYTVAGDTVVVEGSESGSLKNGRTWKHVRFCTVFTFKEGLITRTHLYGDPDLTGADTDRFLWGEPRQTLWRPGADVTSDLRNED